MSLVVLVILAVVWAVFLLPQLFRARAERSTDSIGAFRHQLSILERTAPASSSTVTQLRRSTPPRSRAGSRVPAAPQPQRRSAAPVGRVAHARLQAPRAVTTRRHQAVRASARKRRRDVFCGLLVAMGATLVLGLIPALRVVLVAHVVIDVVFVAYVAMLVRARNLAAERDLKVRFLPRASAAQPSLALRRSAN